MSKAGREQRLAALAIRKMAIVCSANNRFENAAVFRGKRLTALSKSEAHALLNLEHKWLIFTFVLVQGEGAKRLHHISIKSSPCKSDDLQEHTKEAMKNWCEATRTTSFLAALLQRCVKISKTAS